jgi:hypothetical protein
MSSSVEQSYPVIFPGKVLTFCPLIIADGHDIRTEREIARKQHILAIFKDISSLNGKQIRLYLPPAITVKTNADPSLATSPIKRENLQNPSL